MMDLIKWSGSHTPSMVGFSFCRVDNVKLVLQAMSVLGVGQR